jgi:hypothetical protein
MSLSKQINELTVRELVQAWGGRLPTWDEFKGASRAGTVRVNKGVIVEMVVAGAVPRSYAILYGMIVLPISILIIPLAIAAYVFNWLGGWGLFGSVLVAGYLFKVAAYDGALRATLAAAETSEAVYQRLIQSGALLFHP